MVDVFLQSFQKTWRFSDGSAQHIDCNALSFNLHFLKMHQADAFIQHHLPCIQAIYFLLFVCSQGFQPTTFVLLMLWAIIELQEQIYLITLIFDDRQTDHYNGSSLLCNIPSQSQGRSLYRHKIQNLLIRMNFPIISCHSAQLSFVSPARLSIHSVCMYIYMLIT